MGGLRSDRCGNSEDGLGSLFRHLPGKRPHGDPALAPREGNPPQTRPMLDRIPGWRIGKNPYSCASAKAARPSRRSSRAIPDRQDERTNPRSMANQLISYSTNPGSRLAPR